MKRFRLSTLLLLVVIAALSFALMMQQIRTSRLVAELEARRAEVETVNVNMEIMMQMEKARSKELSDQLEAAKGAAR
jgi:hypothetical protein